MCGALTALGGDELAISEAFSRVQRFDALVGAVERKLEVLGTLAQRRVDQASAMRARRTANILGGLTGLTIVTVTLALLGSFLGSRTEAPGPTWLRFVIVGAAFVLAVLVYLRAFGEHSRAPRPPQSEPQRPSAGRR